MFLMRADTLRGQVGGGWALEISRFLGPKWHLPIGSMPFFSQDPKKLSISRAQPPPSCPRNVSARIKNIKHGALYILGA